MRVIRPVALTTAGRRRPMLLALSMLATGLLALELTLIGPASATRVAIMGSAAAVGIGIGAAWLVRVFRPDPSRSAADGLATLLATAFDDSYTLLLAPRLPIRDAGRLDGILVGPAGVRVLTVRDWVGRYRVRGRIWEFDARGRRGWIRCRTNPSFDATALADGFSRWLRQGRLPDVPMRPAIAFPRRHSRVVLEQPTDEVVTAENAPWWANTIGRVRRLDEATGARLIEAVLDAAEAPATARRATTVQSRP